MRILVDEEGLEWNEAWAITKNTIAYTNHTIMPEALEKWPIDMFKPLLPRIYMIIDEINRRWLIDVRDRYPNNEQKVHGSRSSRTAWSTWLACRSSVRTASTALRKSIRTS